MSFLTHFVELLSSSSLSLMCCDLILSLFIRCRPGTRVLKKKKLKINLNRPVGTRVVFDDEGNTLPPLGLLADMNADVNLDKNKGRFKCSVAANLFRFPLLRICIL